MLTLLVCVFQILSCGRQEGECPAWLLNKTDDRLTFINNSSTTITYTFTYEYPNDSSHLEMVVPTALVVNANPYMNIPPNSRGKYTARGCWEGLFKNHILSDTLRILIFETDSLKLLAPSEIINRGLYKSYLYTLQELKNNNWQVVYP
jgi:hypothetical protein